MYASDWAKKNLETLNSESFQQFIETDLMQFIYKEYKNECKQMNSPFLPLELLKTSFNLKSLSINTAWRWLNYLGFRFKKRTKTYFNDKHEDPSIIIERITFIKKYLRYELNSFLWVQLTEEEGERMQLLDAYYAYEKNNIKMREYHIDTLHNKQLTSIPCLSVRKPLHVRPLIIVGQDESAFKQNSFSANCWFGPGGECKLMPKSDGYTQMVSLL